MHKVKSIKTLFLVLFHSAGRTQIACWLGWRKALISVCIVLGWSVTYFLRSALCDLREHLPVDVPASFFLKDGIQVFFSYNVKANSQCLKICPLGFSIYGEIDFRLRFWWGRCFPLVISWYFLTPSHLAVSNMLLVTLLTWACLCLQLTQCKRFSSVTFLQYQIYFSS